MDMCFSDHGYPLSGNMDKYSGSVGKVQYMCLCVFVGVCVCVCLCVFGCMHAYIYLQGYRSLNIFTGSDSLDSMFLGTPGLPAHQEQLFD